MEKRYNEEALQKAVHQALSDPSTVLNTVNDKRLQILSLGRINPYEGPDFKDIAILLNGTIVIGDAEFHRKSSEWKSHGHDKDLNYKNVMLHIVFENNFDTGHETLVVNEKEIVSAINEPAAEADINSIEDLQHFALIRLLRKTAESQKLINNNGISSAFRISIIEFLKRYDSKRRRPSYTKERLALIAANIESSEGLEFLHAIYNSEDISIQDSMQVLLRSKLYDEGAHLRREIILNCILPLALCIANEEKRIDLFLWYWATPALFPYGLLRRRFPEIPQNFLWQQQGMLEYIKDYGKKPGMVAEKETFNSYGFSEILSFYKVAGVTMHPLEEMKENY